MKTTIIISVYQDVQALSLILSALQRQTYQNFEIIISEDGESPIMKNYTTTLQHYNTTTLQHYNTTTLQHYNT